MNKDGYVQKRVGIKKYKLEHRTVVENSIGRPLKRLEVVHHWNENRLDNSKNNLSLFRHQAAHLRFHKFAKRHGIKVESLKFEQPWLAVAT